MKGYRISVIRHGRTAANEKGIYIGRTDYPLSDRGSAELCNKMDEFVYPNVARVYSSPLLRCRETAEILFPGQVLCVQEGLQETDFGDFEYKNYEELKENPAYQAWIDSGGQMTVPNGESGAGFRHRCCRAYEQCVRDAQEKGAQRIVIVCHGGTIMSVLERYGRPEKSFYEWQIANGCGILTETIEEGGYQYGIREIGKWE